MLGNQPMAKEVQNCRILFPSKQSVSNLFPISTSRCPPGDIDKKLGCYYFYSINNTATATSTPTMSDVVVAWNTYLCTLGTCLHVVYQC